MPTIGELIKQSKTAEEAPAPSGLPESTLSGAMTEGLPAAQSMVMPTLKAIAPAVAPTVGAALGGMSPMPGGAAMGAMAGEGLNQLTGVTEPSLTQIGLQGFLPAAASAVTNTGRTLLRMSGARGAEALNTLAPQHAAEMLGKMQPYLPSKFYFKMATQDKAEIPLTKTEGVLQGLIDDLKMASGGIQSHQAPVLKYLEGLQQKIIGRPTGIPASELQAELNGLGELVKSSRRQGGPGEKSYKQVYSKLMTDLDTAADTANLGLPAAQALKAARDTFRREATLDEIGTAVTNAVKTKQGVPTEPFNAAEVIRSLKKNEMFVKAFSIDERKEIYDTFKLLNRIPGLSPGAGQSFGSGQFWKKAGTIGTASAIGGGMGGVPGATAGAALGAIVPPIAETARNLSIAMQTRVGRGLLKTLLTNSDHALTPQGASILAAFATAQMASPTANFLNEGVQP